VQNTRPGLQTTFKTVFFFALLETQRSVECETE
jgi:hypothetical protein